MANNSFGNIFRITTWGESHGKALGVVIDGCPAGLSLCASEINDELRKRAPGNNPYTSPRTEQDLAEIYSGVFEGKTTGAPISIIIMNRDSDSTKYEPIKNLLRPGHANFTYLEKYGIFDYKGGGRSSARETVCRVAAGAVAQKILQKHGIQICSYLSHVCDIQADSSKMSFKTLQENTQNSSIFCPDALAEKQMKEKISTTKEAGDSLGGIVNICVTGLPVGLGDPVYEKLEANLAKAMLGIPASKGFEIGEGFRAAQMLGSQHNDVFASKTDKIYTHTNHAGGTLGGISTGMDLNARVVFKPTSSIQKTQDTIDINGVPSEFNLPVGSRHDPCVAIRAVPIVTAMTSLVLVDALLMNRCAKL